MIYLILFLIVIASDQLLKYWTISHLALGQVKILVPHLMSLTYLQNNGAAWNILAGRQIFFLILTPVVMVVLIYLLYRAPHKQYFYATGLTLMIAGALGNFIDRVRLGYVVDMLQLDWFNFPIFNLADTALTVGIILIFIDLIFKDEKG